MAPRRLLSLVHHATQICLLLTALFGIGTAYASPSSGLEVTGWRIESAPPERVDLEAQRCGEGYYANINQSWDWETFAQCGSDLFMLRYRGTLTIPDGVTSVRFAVASDDGGLMSLGPATFGSWSDRPCMVDYSERLEVAPGQVLPLEGWFYENGGGTCFMLWWQIGDDSSDWSVVEESAFSPWTSPTTTTTTSTSTTTTSTTTTTTTSTTVVEPTTTVEVLPETSTTQTYSPTSTPIQTDQTTTSTLPTPTTSSTSSTTTVVVPTTPLELGTTTTSTPDPTTTMVELPVGTTTTVVIDSPIASVNGGTVGKGMKPARLVSRALRDGVSAGQQRAVVAGAVLIAMPSAFRPSGRRT